MLAFLLLKKWTKNVENGVAEMKCIDRNSLLATDTGIEFWISLELADGRLKYLFRTVMLEPMHFQRLLFEWFS